MSVIFDAERLRNWSIPDVRRSYSKLDTMLYALGVGLGSDPQSVEQLRFVYEQNLQALPSFPTVLGYPFLWYAEPGTGIDLLNVVHAEMGFENHSTVPVEGTVRSVTRIIDVEDKGARVGALLSTRCEIFDTASGALISTLHSASLARANGGFEPTPGRRPSAGRPPEREPDAACNIATLPQAALIYRLSGDFNPLHADPKVAGKVGLPGPLLHGRCTFGIAAWALMQLCCGYDAQRLKRMCCRFSSPVFPGDVIRTEIWENGPDIRFRCCVPQRGGAVVLSHGQAEIVF